MPTNDERREVAENLRTMTMRGCRYKEEFYDLLNETVMNEWDFHSFSDVAERLADLIEPDPERTCAFTDNWNDPDLPLPTCSACGWEAEETDCVCVIGGPMFQYGGKFCKECGAKVVSECE